MEFLDPQIYFRVFEEKDLKDINEKYDNKLCIKMKKDFCFIRAEENTGSEINLTNIALA